VTARPAVISQNRPVRETGDNLKEHACHYEKNKAHRRISSAVGFSLKKESIMRSFFRRRQGYGVTW